MLLMKTSGATRNYDVAMTKAKPWAGEQNMFVAGELEPHAGQRARPGERERPVREVIPSGFEAGGSDA